MPFCWVVGARWGPMSQPQAKETLTEESLNSLPKVIGRVREFIKSQNENLVFYAREGKRHFDQANAVVDTENLRSRRKEIISPMLKSRLQLREEANRSQEHAKPIETKTLTDKDNVELIYGTSRNLPKKRKQDSPLLEPRPAQGAPKDEEHKNRMHFNV